MDKATPMNPSRLGEEPAEIIVGQVWRWDNGALRYVAGLDANGWVLKDAKGVVCNIIDAEGLREEYEFVSSPSPVRLLSRWRNQASGATFKVIGTSVLDRYCLLGPNRLTTCWWSGDVLRFAFQEVA